MTYDPRPLEYIVHSPLDQKAVLGCRQALDENSRRSVLNVQSWGGLCLAVN